MNKKLILITAIICSLLPCCEGEKVEEKVIVVDKSIVVQTTKIKPIDIVQYIESSAVSSANQEAEVSSEVSGKIKKIFVEFGDFVKTNDPIVELDSELLKLKNDFSAAAVTQVEGHYVASAKDLLAKEELHKQGIISSQEIDRARAKVKNDLGRFESAKASLNISKRDVRECIVRSPIDGYIVDRNFDIGTIISTTDIIANVVDASKIKIKIGLSELQIAKITKGSDVIVYADALPNISFKGTVFTVGAKANEDTLTFPAEVIVENNQEVILRVGMILRVKIDVGEYKDAILVNQESIVEDDSGSYVFVVKDSVAKKVKITKGITISSDVLIASGLSAGDIVVTAGSQNLYDNAKVKVQN